MGFWDLGFFFFFGDEWEVFNDLYICGSAYG